MKNNIKAVCQDMRYEETSVDDLLWATRGYVSDIEALYNGLGKEVAWKVKTVYGETITRSMLKDALWIAYTNKKEDTLIEELKFDTFEHLNHRIGSYSTIANSLPSQIDMVCKINEIVRCINKIMRKEKENDVI